MRDDTWVHCVLLGRVDPQHSSTLSTESRHCNTGSANGKFVISICAETPFSTFQPYVTKIQARQLVPKACLSDRKVCMGLGASAAVRYMWLLQQYLWRAQPLVQG
jgi:hypothetical protein